MNGFSLHVVVSTGADERQAVEQLCQHIARPALANTRAKFSDIG
jgi:hypothetical protein